MLCFSRSTFCRTRVHCFISRYTPPFYKERTGFKATRSPYRFYPDVYTWSVGRIAFLFLTILGGVAFQSFVFLFGAAMNFRWLHSGRSVSSNLRLMIDFTQYPLSIYPKGLQSFLTFVVPVGMINYYPCLYLFGRGNDAWFYPWLSWIAPTVAIGVGLLGLIFWQHGVNSYQSSGS